MALAKARWLPYEANDASWNMALDAVLAASANRPTLRFYGWSPPALSLGHFQGRREPLDADAVRRMGLTVVRRATGGGAIVHWHELTYSLVLPVDHPSIVGIPPRESYAVLHRPIVDALTALGVTVTYRTEDEPSNGRFLCFDRATTLDLIVDGRKLLGSAQRRTERRLLQHGSLILATNPLQPDTASLSEILGRSVDPRDLVDSMVAAFSVHWGPMELCPATTEERSAAWDRRADFLVPDLLGLNRA